MKFNTEDINKAINKEIKKEIKKEYKKKEKKIIKDEISNKIIETTAIIIRNEGITKLNVSKILKKLGISNRVFYNRFNNLEEVLEEVYNKIVIQIREKLNHEYDEKQDFFEYLLDLVENSLLLSYELKTQLNLYIFGSDAYSQYNYEWYIDRITKLLNYAKENNLIIDVDSEVFGYTMWCAIRGYNADAVIRMEKEEAIKQIRYSFNLLLQGIKKQK